MGKYILVERQDNEKYIKSSWVAMNATKKLKQSEGMENDSM